MKQLLLCLLCLPLLTGCTDIRTRLLPDILAVDQGTPVRFAAHTSQETGITAAQAETALLMPDALRNASGAEISTGHLTLLAVSGNPVSVLEAYFQAQMLAPSCIVLSVAADACGQLREGRLPSPAQLQSAAETGQLPHRAADTVLADLWGGSGITAVCTAKQSGLTLSLWSQEGCLGELSGDACRGLALLGRRYSDFSFASDGITYRLKPASVRIEAEQRSTLHIVLTVTAEAEPPLTAPAAGRLTEMLTAAVTETAGIQGADLLFLREYAIRSGITAARNCSQAEWRTMLQAAEYTAAFCP